MSTSAGIKGVTINIKDGKTKATASLPGTGLTYSTSSLDLPGHSFWFTLVVALAPHFAWASELQGKVIAIADGDTITVLDATQTQHKIRLAGIDAPEKKMPFGQASKMHLSQKVFGRDVRLNCGKTDKYKRKICVIYVNGQDANLAQVKGGMAWWYRKYQREQTEVQRTAYETAESAARSGRVGLWQDSNPLPPWEFRHRKK